jgi:signal transduction histidine kinase
VWALATPLRRSATAALSAWRSFVRERRLTRQDHALRSRPLAILGDLDSLALVTSTERVRRIPVGFDAALAFAASGAAFAVVAVAVANIHSDVLAVLIAVPLLAAIVAVVRRARVAYAVPVATAITVAYDWYYIPPTHSDGFPSVESLVELVLYLGVAVLVGQVLSRAVEQADASNRRLAELAGEQAALRRVATLVAREPSPAGVFAAVAEEVGLLLGAEQTLLIRYEPDASITVLASWGRPVGAFPVGENLPVDGKSVAASVLHTARPARVDDYANVEGRLAAYVSAAGIRSAVGSPIVVDGGLWGAVIAASPRPNALPARGESRMKEFTELVATAISNIEARSELAASRARIVVATDEARRRFERDLHDGAQQRLVSLALELRTAEAIVAPESSDIRAQLSHVGDGLIDVLDGLRELSRGIHPAILSEGGLGPALRTLSRRTAVPTSLKLELDGRLDQRVEVAAYYVVSEALANAAKHAEASAAEVDVAVREGILDIAVTDDGIGGADPTSGSGLVGLADRVEALGGTMTVVSPTGDGTCVRVELPADVEAVAPSS